MEVLLQPWSEDRLEQEGSGLPKPQILNLQVVMQGAPSSRV